MSSNRTFHVVSERDPDSGAQRSVVRLQCSKCNRTKSIVAPMRDNGVAPELVMRKFTQAGWSVGHNDTHDVCNEHSAAKERRQPDLIVEPVREMKLPDKRRIIERLSDTYIDERRGYAPGWSDHKLSVELNLPRKWVETTREENFGPVKTTEARDAFIAESERLIGDLRSFISEARSFDELWSEQRKRLDELLGRCAKIELTVKAIEKGEV